MFVANVFGEEGVGRSLSRIKCCVEGIHINATFLGGDPSSSTVTSCDGTCAGKPTIREIEFSPEDLLELRSLVGKGPAHFSPRL
jgi:hypothetical protein